MKVGFCSSFVCQEGSDSAWLLLLSVMLMIRINIAKAMSPSTTTATSVTTTLPTSSSSPRIAIIGGGAAGLVAARVVSREKTNNNGGNHVKPLLLEQDSFIGGVWQYHPHSKTRPMYGGLRTNLPKEIMAFRELPWRTTTTTTTTTSDREESYVSHQTVLEYLQAYQQTFDVTKYITFGAKVKQLTMLENTRSQISPPLEHWPQVQLEWEIQDTESKTCIKSQIFDAVYVCNGHFSIPSFSDVPGLRAHFHGRTMHSIEYDDPTEFSGQIVLCIGGRASGSDLAREISKYANHVYLSDTACPPLEGRSPQQLNNITWVPKTVQVQSDGSIVFDDNCRLRPKVDTIIFCSGYDYNFPFINERSNLELSAIPGERRVTPLYEQLWHARYPNVAFIGIPHSILPFPLFELQAEAVWAQWTNRKQFQLPPVEERLEAAAKDAVSGGAKSNGRIQDTHYLGSAQWEYCRWMAKLAGLYDETTRSVRFFSSRRYRMDR